MAFWFHDLLEPWIYLLLQASKALLWSVWTPLFILDTLPIELFLGVLFGKYLPIIIRVGTWLSVPTM